LGVIYRVGCAIQRMFMVDVAANCRKVLQRIAEAAAKSGRDPSTVRLLAATKSQGVAQIRAAVEAGIRLFGENYVQEARAKKAAIGEPVEWHMIGHLQRNKVKAALEIFSLIQSLDSLGLARELDKEGRRRGSVVRSFLEVNLGGEESKSGVSNDGVLALVKELGSLSHVRVEGLMTVPPFREDPEEVRSYFRALKELQTELKGLGVGNVDPGELSMGMTHDYSVAVEEGATLVRIGTAIFGPRKE